MSDPRTLRELAEQLAQEWWSTPSTEIVAVVLERAMRQAIEATLDVECKRNQTVIFKKAYMRGLVGDVATRMAELLKAEAKNG